MLQCNRAGYGPKVEFQPWIRVEAGLVAPPRLRTLELGQTSDLS